jgi:hypothetical protein
MKQIKRKTQREVRLEIKRGRQTRHDAPWHRYMHVLACVRTCGVATRERGDGAEKGRGGAAGWTGWGCRPHLDLPPGDDRMLCAERGNEANAEEEGAESAGARCGVGDGPGASRHVQHEKGRGGELRPLPNGIPFLFASILPIRAAITTAEESARIEVE